MDLLTRNQTVARLIAEYDDPKPFDSAAEMGEMLAALIDTLRPEGDNELVIFHWHRQWGTCYECGLPAAFWLYDDHRPKPEEDDKRCAVCAANDAAQGGDIRRIDNSD